MSLDRTPCGFVDGALRELTSDLCWDQVSGLTEEQAWETLMNRQTFFFPTRGRKHKFADVEQLGGFNSYSTGNKLS